MKKSLTILWLTAIVTTQATPAHAVTIGSFSYTKQFDEFTDSDKSFITTQAIEKNGNIVWRCIESEMEFFMFQSGQEYNPEETYSVLYRFDKKESGLIEDWTSATNGGALFMDEFYLNDFTDEAINSSQLLIRTEDDDGDLLVSTFKLSGLKSALSNMSCADLFN